MKWTIKNRLRLMLTVTLAGIAIVVGFMLYAFFTEGNLNDKIADLDASIRETKEINVNMAKVRQREQEFLRNPGKELADNVKETVAGIQKSAAQLKKNENNKKIAEQFSGIEAQAKAYVDAFDRLSLMKESTGYTAEDGLRKTMDENLSTLEKIIVSGNHPKLEKQLYLLTAYEKEFLASQAEETYTAHKEAADQFGTLLDDSNLSSENKQTITTNFLKYTSSFDSVHNSYTETNRLLKEFNTAANEVETSVGSIVTQLEQNKDALVSDQSSLQHLLTILLVIISVITIGLILFLGVWLTRSIDGSISTLKKGANVIGDGNLAYRVNLNTEDEMSDLAQTFNTMAENMQRSMKKVLHASDHLSSSSQNLAAVSEETTAQSNEVNQAILQVSAGAQNQAEHLEESTELISTVTSAVEKTASYSEQISTDSANAQHQGKEGLEIVNGLNVTSEQFVDLATRLVNEVQNTNEQSKQINSIVSTIREIAGNTDLLALNAAIESARAGEAGRGFAVVAQEVRKLAERSKEEALNIQKVVNLTSEQMNKLLEEAEQLDEYREEQDRSVKQTKHAFETIVANVTSINNRITGAQEAISQVQDANTNLSSKLEEVSAISEESAASAQEVTASSEHQKEAIEQVSQAAFELQNIAVDLQQEVNLFQLLGEDPQDVQEGKEPVELDDDLFQEENTEKLIAAEEDEDDQSNADEKNV